MINIAALASLALYVSSAFAGATIWSGSFENYPSSASFDNWTWGSQVGAYQWYIKGTGATNKYLNVASSYKNPAVTSESRGLKLTIDSSSIWNGQSTFERTELIPFSTTANLGSGNLFYHFSVKRSAVNAPNPAYEHQVLFFESHFTELKYGVGPNPTHLSWLVGGAVKWSTPFNADTWFNFAYDIDFSAKTVGLWASTNGGSLVKVVNNIGANTFTDGKDFHVGLLRLGVDSSPEDWYISGVYIESGPVTTAIGNGSAPPVTSPGPVTSVPVTSVGGGVPTTQAPPTPTTTASGPTQTQWGQCGGKNFAGPFNCASPFKCVVLNEFYHQCQ